LYVAPNPSYQAIKYSTTQYTAAKFRFDSKPYVFGGTICALISIFFVPLLFGMIAIICGGMVLSKAKQSGQRQQGWFVIALGVLCMVIRLILGMLIALPYM
jgi:cell division protein FtsX